MATAMGKGHQGGIRSPVRGGIGAFIVAKQMGPDPAPGGLFAKFFYAVFFPRLAPWAEGCRRYAAWNDEKDLLGRTPRR